MQREVNAPALRSILALLCPEGVQETKTAHWGHETLRIDRLRLPLRRAGLIPPDLTCPSSSSIPPPALPLQIPSEFGVWDLAIDLLDNDSTSALNKPKKKRKRERPSHESNLSAKTSSNGKRKVSLEELSEEKQSAMRTALLSRRAASLESALSLLTQRQQKMDTLFALKLLCKQTILDKDRSQRWSRKDSNSESVMRLVLQSSHYVPIFGIEQETCAPAQPKGLSVANQIPKQPLQKGRQLKLSYPRQAVEEVSLMSVLPHTEPIAPPSLSVSQATQPQFLSESIPTEDSVEVLGSFARVVPSPCGNHRYLLLVCLRNISR
jgi:hypothetical protein